MRRVVCVVCVCVVLADYLCMLRALTQKSWCSLTIRSMYTRDKTKHSQLQPKYLAILHTHTHTHRAKKETHILTHSSPLPCVSWQDEWLD